jgi:hypothetical protein
VSALEERATKQGSIAMEPAGTCDACDLPLETYSLGAGPALCLVCHGGCLLCGSCPALGSAPCACHGAPAEQMEGGATCR